MATCCLMIFSDRTTDMKLNRTFEEALRLLCKGTALKLENLMEKCGTIRQHNLPFQLVAIFKTKNNLNPTHMKKDLY